MAFETVDDILDFAIRKEEEAAKMYTSLADRAKFEYMRRMLHEFAAEEQGHKTKLLAIKEGQQFELSTEKVTSLGVADYVKDVEPTDDMDFQAVLLFAMKEEKAAFAMYTKLAESADDDSLRDTLLALAQEEARHKLRFEIEYDEHVLVED